MVGGETVESPGQLEITVPADLLTVGSYAVLDIQDQETGSNFSSGSLIYVDRVGDSAIACLTPGLWFNINSGECLACPDGGECPGGSRIYPKLGFWSANELVAPGKCDLEDACPGAVGQNSAYPPVVSESSGERVTSRCAEREGYSGAYCSECQSGFYRDVVACTKCEGGDTEFALLIVTALIIFGLVGLAVALAPIKRLTMGVSLLLTFQQLIYVGRLSSAYLSGSKGERLRDLFRTLSFFLFDVDFAKSDCHIERVTFADVYWGTLVIVAMGMVWFAFCALLYAYRKRKKNKAILARSHDHDHDDDYEQEETEDEEASYDVDTAGATTATTVDSLATAGSGSGVESGSSAPFESSARDGTSSAPAGKESSPEKQKSRFKAFFLGGKDKMDEDLHASFWQIYIRRVYLAFVLLCSAAFLQITIRNLQGVHCIKRGESGTLTLSIEAQTECYTGEHGRMVWMAWLLLFVYCIGFPVVCGWLMFKANKNGWSASSRIAFSFLIRGLHREFWWFRLLAFATNIAVATQTVVIQRPVLKVATAALSFLVNTVIVTIVWPMKAPAANYLQLAVGLVASIQILLIIDSDAFQGNTDDESIWLLVAICAVVLFCILYRAYVWYSSDKETRKALCSCSGWHDDLDVHKEDPNAIQTYTTAISLSTLPPSSSSSSSYTYLPISSTTTTRSTVSSSSSFSSSSSSIQYVEEVVVEPEESKIKPSFVLEQDDGDSSDEDALRKHGYHAHLMSDEQDWESMNEL